MKILDYLGLTTLVDFCKEYFAKINHTHKVADLEDYTVDPSLSSTSRNPVENKAVKTELDTKVPTSRTVNGKSLSSDITLSASDVGADASGSASTVQSNLNSHTDNTDVHITSDERDNWNTAVEHISDEDVHIPEGGSEGQILSLGTDGIASWTDRNIYFVNISIDDEGNFASDTTYDEIAEKLINNTSVYMDISKIDIGLIYLPFFMVQSKALMFGMFLVNAISGLAILPDNSIEEFSFRLTASDVGLGNVEDKSAATILNELTKENVTHALGYTPLQQSDLDVVEDKVDDHIADTDIHFTSEERTKLAGIATGANKYTHPNSGVTAGTYKSVTVNAAGHVTGGTNPTTLSGFGITDAYTTSQVDSKIATSLSSAKTYADGLIDEIMGEGAADTLDTIGEISAAIEENQDAVDLLNAAIGNKVDKVSGKGLSTNDYTTTEKTKLAGIATGAEVNQNAFSNIVVGSTTIAADSKTDSLTLAGSNVTISADATNDKVTFSVANGTTSAKGVVQLTNSTSSTSTTTAATPNSVKSAYDLANTANNAAIAAQATADSKAPSSHNHDASNITSGTISTSRLPQANGNTAGITIVYPASQCTSFSSDSGTVTPLAVQKGAKQFAITRPSSSTDKAITRYSNTTGDVQDSKIIIEDVTNTRDTSKKAQVIAIPAEGGKKMVYGYCTDQIDGTSFIGGIFDASATEYPYNQGLAIGGTSGNLLWKGAKVAVTSDIPNAFSNIKVGGTTVTADAKTDTLTLAGSNVTLTPDATNDKVTIGITKDNVVSALGYEPGQTNAIVIENVTIPVSGFVAQDDGTYLYTLTSDLVVDDTLVDVYFSKDCQKAGMKAGIMVTSEVGKIHFHATKLPTISLVVETMMIHIMKLMIQK